jgi:hypothetical protein
MVKEILLLAKKTGDIGLVKFTKFVKKKSGVPSKATLVKAREPVIPSP